MATSDFLPFAAASGANVLSQSDYAALPALSTGYGSGLAKSQQLNKTWRQSSIMAAVVGLFITNQSGQNAVDDGTTSTLLSNLIAGVKATTVSQFAQNLTSPGYVKFPNGVIIQWGQSANSPSTTTATTFPIAFPNFCLSVTGCGLQASFGVQAYITLNGRSATGFTWGAFAANSGSAPTNSATANQVQNWWIAIGY